MKATWKPRPGETGTTIVLGDDALGFRQAGSKFIKGCWPESVTWQNQPAAYPGADTIDTFGRGNLSTVYTVIVDLQFATIGQRTAFEHRHANDLANEGTLEILHDAGGVDAMTAVIQSVQFTERNGLSVTVHYTFLGGVFSKGPASNLIPVP